jgi:hypothetical protein
MAQKLLVVVAVVGVLYVSAFGQAKPSIQGVWRPVEVTITNPNNTPLGLGKGTHTNLQPALMIVTAKHWSTVLDTAGKPRPTAPFKDPQKPTAEEMQAAWGPFNAVAGTYEVSGNTVTARSMVSKNPAAQGKGFVRYSMKLDGDCLWLTQLENAQGKIQYPNTVKYARVE